MKKYVNHYLTFNRLILSLIGISSSLLLSGSNLMSQAGHNTFPEEPSTAGTRIVINEIMADPTPLVGLPDAEWIELYNNSAFPVRLKEWKIGVGSTFRLLPDSVISPGQFGILCSASVATEMRKSGRTIVLSALPPLRNSGNQIVLKDAGNLTVDSIDYSDRWYGIPAKKEGGWSLERIDPDRACGQVLNWKASEDPSGGTPGRQNALFAKNPDVTPPEIALQSVLHPFTVEIRFSEWMDTLTTRNNSCYTLSDGMGNPVSVLVVDEKSVRLVWNSPLEENRIYRLTITTLADLCGNIMPDKETEVCRIILKTGDILLSEILFNPWTGGSDFVEIFNHSQHAVPVEKLVIGSRDKSGQLISLTELTTCRLVLSPGAYMVLTTDSTAVFHFYRALCRDCICQVPRLPAYNNDKGTVIILNELLVILEEFSYSEEMHYPLIINREGISLERTSFEKPADAPDNWHSAAADAGFATPGYKNSQALPEFRKKIKITCKQEYISPDNNGYNDELEVEYQLPSPGWTLNCRIFDTSGKQMMHWMNNLLLGTSGVINWNGKDAGNRMIPPGPYVLFFEFFDMAGHAERYRKVVVVAR